jgi:hypothetical protein
MPLPLGDGFLVSLPYGPSATGSATSSLPAALRPALRVVPGIRFLRLSRAR